MPFLYGLEMSGLINTQINLSRDIPSECARKLLNNEVDIGLIPVAVIPQLNESYIISDYCIGANGAVNSVMLYSEVPLEKIEKIHLDYQSRTSVQLVKILAKEFWKINPEFIAAEKGFENTISGNTAAVVIGDRTFELNNKFPFVFDLPQEWKKMTGLPFVFATWVANKKIADDFLQQFNTALKQGISNIEKSITHYHLQEKYPTNVSEYLKSYIQYNFGEAQKTALKTFLSKI
jgi:chorismate dehydratase